MEAREANRRAIDRAAEILTMTPVQVRWEAHGETWYASVRTSSMLVGRYGPTPGAAVADCYAALIEMLTYDPVTGRVRS